jgi:hypothetical protein
MFSLSKRYINKSLIFCAPISLVRIGCYQENHANIDTMEFQERLSSSEAFIRGL